MNLVVVGEPGHVVNRLGKEGEGDKHHVQEFQLHRPVLVLLNPSDYGDRNRRCLPPVLGSQHRTALGTERAVIRNLTVWNVGPTLLAMIGCRPGGYVSRLHLWLRTD